MRRKLGRAAAWIVTAALLAYLFWRIPFHDVVAAASNAAGWTVPVIAALVLLVYLADSLAMWKTFGWFVAPLGFREVLTLRGATYLLALVNYALGQGAIVYFVNRSRGVPVVRGAAAVLLIMGTHVLLLLFLTTAGLALGADAMPALRTVVLALYGGLALYIVLLIWRPAVLTRRPLFDVLLTAGLRGHLKALVVRLPHTLSLLLLNYAGLRAFGVAVPVLQAVLFLPIVFFIAVLPVSVQGLGTTQWVMITFFARYAPGNTAAREAAIFAAGLGLQVVAWAIQILLGLVCLRSQLAQGLKDLPKEMPAAS